MRVRERVRVCVRVRIHRHARVRALVRFVHTHTHADIYQAVSVSGQDDIAELGKSNSRSTQSLSSVPKVALETVPMFLRSITDRSRPRRVDIRPLPLSTPLSRLQAADQRCGALPACPYSAGKFISQTH